METIEVKIRPLVFTDIRVCGAILRSLPQWFGIEESIQEYEQDLKNLDGYVALSENTIIGFVGLKRYGKHHIW